jgi:hypothetical protein
MRCHLAATLLRKCKYAKVVVIVSTSAGFLCGFGFYENNYAAVGIFSAVL